MRFGVEIELDDFDGRDFSERPLAQGEMPAGMNHVVELVSGLGVEVHSHGWKHNHNNSVWVCKPDSSCGIELCSPVMGEDGLDEVLKVADALAADRRVTTGPNCSLHVHVDVSSLIEGLPESSAPLCSALAWWVKCEPFMMDSAPDRRRNSRFCRCIGMTDLFDDEERVVPCIAVGKLKNKYLSLNTYHLFARKRNSIEFRILEGTKDSSLIRSWIKFVLNFVGRSVAAGIPDNYRWVSRPELESLVGSDDHISWLDERIRRNGRECSSRFWRARSHFENSSVYPYDFFGRTADFIGPFGDK